MASVAIAPGCEVEVPEAPWNARDRAAWYWPEPMKPAAWPEKYRVLDSDEAAIVGAWKNANAPYLAGIMNLACARGIEELVLKKAAQAGASEAMRNLQGYWAHFDPAPLGLALPNEQKGKQIVENKVIPFFRRTFGRHAELRQLLSKNMHDLKKSQVKLGNGYIMHLMWSGSAASTASDPMKRAISDEVNKFVAWKGVQTNPIDSIEKRLRTYPGHIHILLSTPTTADGTISRRFRAATVRLYFLVACPACGRRQRLVWDQVKFPRELTELADPNAAAARALQEDLVRYECAGCQALLTEPQKKRMVQGGQWGTVESGDGVDGVLGDGRIVNAEAVETWPRGTRMGLHISALYCLWEDCTLAHVVAEFLRARGSLDKLYTWRTETLGEDWEQLADRVRSGDIDDLARRSPAAEGKLPWWTARLLAAIDTQKDHFYVVIRAWGPGLRSRRIWHGKLESFAELAQWCFRTPFANEDPRFPARVCDLVVIDSGGTRHALAAGGATGEKIEGGMERLPASRVMEVYAWCLEHAALVRAIKGDARPLAGTFIRRGKGQYVTDREKRPLPIWLLDVHHFQDLLAELMVQVPAVPSPALDPGTGEVPEVAVEEVEVEPVWALNARNDPEYNRHLTNLHKVSEADGDAIRWRWKPIGSGARVDYRACEGYQVAGAFMAGVELLPALDEYRRFLEEEIAVRGREEPRRSFVTPGGQSFVATQRG